MIDKGFTPEQERVLEQIQKLMNLSAKNPNEHESALAAAKAQELLTKHNLTTAALERSSGASGKRTQEEVEGGFYRYQRELWQAVAKLNFCLHYIESKYVPYEERVRNVRYKKRHRLIGRIVNVRTTINISNYLLAAIERTTREVCEQKKIRHLSGWAMSFREGCSYRLVQRLQEQRNKMIADEEKKAREAEERAARAGVSTETAITIASYIQTEHDANVDELYGEGYSDERRARQAAAAEEERLAEEAHTKWAAENPEEARRQAEEARLEDEKAAKRYRGGGGGRERYDHVNNAAFWAGADAGKKIGLDPQMGDKAKPAGRIK